MPKYVRQRDHTSCGPVAIINILKWLGFNVTYGEYIDVLRAMCRCEPGPRGGTESADMARALRRLKIKYKKYKMPSIKQVDQHLDNGGIILLDYQIPYSTKAGKLIFDKGEWHFALCIGRTSKTYVVVNDGTKHTVGRRSRKTMKALFKNADDPNYGWFIKHQIWRV